MKRAWLGALVALSTLGCNSASNETHSGDTNTEVDMAHAGPTMNFHRINADLVTGGHLTSERSVEVLKEQGVTLVIDLRDEPPEGHKERLEAAGIRWENVPVVWSNPKLADYTAFSALMSENHGEHILVQCQANYRASAMTYAYRARQGGVPEAEARMDMEAVWTPEGRWADYIGEIFSSQ
ncbi:MAG: protein tyrosine phosphatase family protein [Pseudomonadota bacterium]